MVTATLDLYLASTSPRRSALLQAAGLRFQLCVPGPEYEPGGGDEHRSEAGDPLALACLRARRKGLGAQVLDPRVPVLAVDTVVDLDGCELGKPRDRDHAEHMLRQLAGRLHRVHTAHFLVAADGGRSVALAASATVACAPWDPLPMQRYLDSGQWRGKAGSYGVQDDGQHCFHVIEGSQDTVVGLHVPAVMELLARLRGPA